MHTSTLLLAALLATPPGVHAVILTTFDFVGNCTDCAEAAGQGSYEIFASLTLRDYLPGSSLTQDAFESFTYGGSNLVEGFTVTREMWDSGRNGVLNGMLSDATGAPFHLHLRLIKAPDDVWTCTALGAATARSSAACAHTRDVAFMIRQNGSWSLGSPPKDLGPVTK